MKNIILLLAFLLVQNSFSQIKKFGKISKDEFGAIKNKDFKDANAVVLFKNRKTDYEYSGETGWSLVTTIHERIKIVHKEGFDYATKKVKFYTGSDEEKLSIKASTYNIVDGKIEKIKLKKKSIFSTKENKYWSNKKFTMPNISEGSIIEWKYTIRSPHYSSINDVVFQYNIPILYMQASVLIPEYFIFKTDVSKYYMIPVKNSKKNRTINYSYRTEMTSGLGGVEKSERISRQVELSENIYSIKQTNIKPIKEEPFVNNINNYIGKVKFEIVGTKFPNSMYKAYGSTWENVCKTIYKSTNFGEELKKTYYFKKDLQAVLEGITNQNEKIHTIFNYVKSKMTWNAYYDYYTHDGVKKAYKNGVGNVAEINLMLVAMLRESGIDANPILVSTRSHGVPIFPTRKGFNYVIVGIELANEVLLLDATEKYSTINNLPNRVLNWKGRIIRKNGSSTFVDLYPKTYNLEKNRLNVKLDDLGKISGNLRSIFKNSNAIITRNQYASLSKEVLISSLESKLSPIEISNARLGNKDKLGKPFSISIQFVAEDQAETIGSKLYFSPLLFLKETENVFKSETRNLPIDFASAWLDSNDVQIQIPDTYEIETLPETTVINTPNNIASFSYTISTKENRMLLITNTKVNIPVVPSNLYRELKDFYAAMILKMNEKVVLVKK